MSLCVCVCAGGWQEQITYQRHAQNLQLFYRMLRANGFHKDHIKTFFAGNGQLAGEAAHGPDELAVHLEHLPCPIHLQYIKPGIMPLTPTRPRAVCAVEEAEGAYPATEKGVMRNHISYICRKQHCADTLVLYLNSPTRNDGTMLLWDGNYNGIVSRTHTHIRTPFYLHTDNHWCVW